MYCKTMSYKFTKIFLLFTIVNAIFISCQKSNQQNISGQWRATINTDGGELPFHVQFLKKADSTSYEAFVINGKEKFKVDDPILAGDSITIPIDIFDAKITAKIEGESMVGKWQRFVGEGKYLYSNFNAKKGAADRFIVKNTIEAENVSGKWAVNFVDKEGKPTAAVGVFEQNGFEVNGTFLTTTGDYRYLAGTMEGDSLKLSTFDGTHLFLFKAKKTGTLLKGQFWSNISSLENWTATLDANAKLPDLNKLTYMKPGANKFEFSFPDTDGKVLNINDKNFENKVKIIQIMGTWCPNCMDESKYLAPWYDKNKARGIEIVGLAYEKSTELAVSGPKINKMKERFGIKYPVLLAGSKLEGEPEKTLPMLNTVLGFPTTIVIDKKGIVRYIHTGFSGPGTGNYYTEWAQEFNLLIDKLVAE
jgi:thiol-disulfide isomerase/thioredoxin